MGLAGTLRPNHTAQPPSIHTLEALADCSFRGHVEGAGFVVVDRAGSGIVLTCWQGSPNNRNILATFGTEKYDRNFKSATVTTVKDIATDSVENKVYNDLRVLNWDVFRGMPLQVIVNAAAHLAGINPVTDPLPPTDKK